MVITRTSMITGREHTLDLDVTQEQIDAYKRGMLAQHAFPNLSADDREFFMTGVTAEEWAAVFPPEEDKEDEYDQ